jgi:type VI secretion system protein VasD
MRLDRRSLAGGTAAALAWMAPLGCSWFGGKETAPAPVDVTVSAGARLNPDDGGQSLPTVIRVYLLKGTSRAEPAQFEDLYRRDKELLGEDLVQVDELVLSPGETVRKTVGGDKAARAVMVVGVFRRPSGQGWRAIAELPRGGGPPLRFLAEDYRIERR